MRAPCRFVCLSWNFRFARRTSLGRGWMTLLSRVRKRQFCHPLVLPILQHARDLTTVVVMTQRLMFYRRRSRRVVVQIENSLIIALRPHLHADRHAHLNNQLFQSRKTQRPPIGALAVDKRMASMSVPPNASVVLTQYAGTMALARHNATWNWHWCQTERTIFLHVISMG